MSRPVAYLLILVPAYAFLCALGGLAFTVGAGYECYARQMQMMLPAGAREFALPLVTSGILAFLAWGIAAIYPAGAAFIVARRGLPPSMLATLLVPWLLVILAVASLVGAALWAPFAPACATIR